MKNMLENISKIFAKIVFGEAHTLTTFKNFTYDFFTND